MRISRRVHYPAYERTINQLSALGVDVTKLPDAFYFIHWSDRKRYIMREFGLFMCPRCRDVIKPEDKHERVALCKRCGDNTQHRLVYYPDDDPQVVPSHFERPTLAPTKPKISVNDIMARLKGKDNG